MPSPFPGMDPFIESQDWESFHARMITEISDQLVPDLRPAYVCHVQKHVFVLTDQDEIQRHLIPDVQLAAMNFGSSDRSGFDSEIRVATLDPTFVTVPAPLEMEQTFLVIRTTQGREVVAVIEVLSPWNKSRPTGLNEYLTKRNEYYRSSAHVVEIDLLRGGSRLPCRETMPEGDYFAYVSRSHQRPRVEVYAWTLGDSLPTIPVPLREGDVDIPLDLATAFSNVYERAGYDYAIDYDDPLSPQASHAESLWIAEQLAGWHAAKDNRKT